MIIDKNRFNQFAISILVILTAGLSWYWLKIFLFEETQGLIFNTKGTSWIWPVGGFFVFLVLLSLAWLLIKSKNTLLVIPAIVLISSLVSLGFKVEFLAVLALAFLFFLLGTLRAIDEREIRTKIQTRKIIGRGLPLILTGLSLVIAAAYYVSPLISTNQIQIKIPRPWFNLAIRPIEKNLSENESFKNFINQIPQESKSASEENESQRDNLYQLVNREINHFSQPYQQYFPLGLAIGFFFALKLISIPLIWLVILLTWLIFKTLIWSKVIRITKKEVSREEIEV